MTHEEYARALAYLDEIEEWTSPRGEELIAAGIRHLFVKGQVAALRVYLGSVSPEAMSRIGA